jgi:tRNA 5-methylaminomethyl-2-thiouridine biosynthesis bifunctional protein
VIFFFPAKAALAKPQLRWEDKTPYNEEYGDIYGSRAGALAETEYVFLGGNGFPARWQSPHVTIAELGFGAGVNFLTSWRQFLTHAPPQARLDFMSVERAPFTAEEILRATAAYPELAPLAAQLAARLPLKIAGIHLLQFDRVTLTLGYGEASEMLPGFRRPVDAWFLDGFAPAKNPDLWSEEILRHVLRLGGTIATYSAAAAVRQTLKELGYEVEKRPGFGHKRAMILATPPASSQPASAQRQTVAVIGGGVAGCATAHALAGRGFAVTLYERGTIACGASGNPRALLYPRLTKHWSEAMSFYLSAYSYMLSHLPYWGVAHGTPGLIKTAHSAQEEARFEHFNLRTGVDAEILRPVSREEATELLGMEAPAGGVYFPRGCWVDPQDLCRKLLAHPAITVHEHHTVTTLAELPEAQVVLSNAWEAAQLAPHHRLPMGRSAGQISLIPAAQLRECPARLYSHRGYAVPAGDDVLIGATYDHDDRSGEVTDANHRRNYEEACAALPGLLRPPEFAAWQGRVSFRATTPSRMPYIGKLAEGLYINAGHGSRGLLSAPYAAMLLAEDIAITAASG